MIARSIIAPITLAADSLVAAATAAAFAAALGAELVLVGIAPVAPPASSPTLNGFDPSVDHLAQQRLVDRIVAERLEELAAAVPANVPRRTILTHGPVGAALVDAARDAGAELIVVPIRRERELAHLIDDHADRFVLHHSDVPVLVVPTDGGAEAR
jgi:nucleotide-binding universal stress UspA family protein